MADPNQILLMAQLASIGATNPAQLATMMAEKGIMPVDAMGNAGTLGPASSGMGVAPEMGQAPAVGAEGTAPDFAKLLGQAGSALKTTQPTMPPAPQVRPITPARGGQVSPQGLQMLIQMMQGGTGATAVPRLGALLGGGK